MEGIVSSVLGSVASAVVSNIFSDKPPQGKRASSIPTPPAPVAPTAMPTPDNASMQAAREKQMAVQMRQNLSRASTILTSKDDKLG